MNVSLTPELEALIQEQLEGGMYSSASEVVLEALRLYFRQRALRELHDDELRSKIEAGVVAVNEGRARPFTRETLEAMKQRARRDE